ncbi:hypothetical protein KKF45_04695, partial [Patescibacteria group bacterium]|nr:hypothetical protein [Patescibacteria group bacterium]
DGNPVKLNYRELKTVAASDGSRILDTASGDKLEVWNGSTFEDYLVTRSAGRKASHYVDAQKGLVYFRTFYKIYGRVAVRVTYRIGISTPSNDVKRACALLVAAQLYSTEDYTVSIPGGGDLNVIPVADKATRYREEAHVILNRYREMVSIW